MDNHLGVDAEICKGLPSELIERIHTTDVNGRPFILNLPKGWLRLLRSQNANEKLYVEDILSASKTIVIGTTPKYAEWLYKIATPHSANTELREAAKVACENWNHRNSLWKRFNQDVKLALNIRAYASLIGINYVTSSLK